MQKTALLFPGQGSQYPGMGKELHDNFKVVKELYEEACDSLSFDIRKLSFEGPEEELTLTKNTQPAILTHSIAAFKVVEQESDLLKDKSSLITAGHSLGEFSALVAAGALSFFDAVKVVNLRGQYMQTACEPGVGTMAAVLGMTSDEVAKTCEDNSTPEAICVPANYNSETQTVISGHTNGVEKVSAAIKGLEGKVIPLSVSAPFHSPLMREASEKLASTLSTTDMNAIHIDYIANINAEIHDSSTTEQTIRENLVKQVYSPVKWYQTMKKFKEIEISRAIEFGPGKVLCGLLKKMDRKLPSNNVDALMHLQKLLGRS